MVEPNTPPAIWRVEAPIRRLAVVVALGFVLIAAAFTVFGVVVVGAVLVWVVALAVMACVWRWFLVPYVSLEADHLEVQGAFAFHRVGYRSIRGVTPGSIGLQIETAKEGPVLVWAVQKSTLAERRHRGSRADAVAAEIMERVEAASA